MFITMNYERFNYEFLEGRFSKWITNFLSSRFVKEANINSASPHLCVEKYKITNSLHAKGTAP